MRNKSQSNSPSMQVTEAPYQKENILPNIYILDSLPSLSPLPKCLEQSKLKGNFYDVDIVVWANCAQHHLPFGRSISGHKPGA